MGEPEHELTGSAWAQDKRARPEGRRKADTRRRRADHAAWVALATVIATTVSQIIDRSC